MSEIASYGNTNAEYTIHVVGKLVGSQYIQMSFDGKASKLTLIGEPDGTNSGILDGNQEGPALWEQTSVPVVITNLKITNGKYTNGGGIYFSGADLTLENGTEISENEATTDSTSGGGGVYATGKLTVKSGCTIKNNKADSGYGGGIYMSSGNKTVTIETGATLEGNTAEAGGAISIDTGTLELSGGTLKSNYATEKGGAIYNNATLNINSGTLSENKASGSGGNGGGIYCYNGSCLIKGGSIKNNYAVYDGGAVYIGYNSSVTLDGGTIGGASSSDKNSSGNNGGGVYVLNGTFTLKSGTIAYNEAVKAGAGIYNYKTCNIEGGSIENNTLTGSETLQGGGIYNIANCTMTDGTIKNNSAGTGFGGGVFTSNGNSGTFTMSGGTVDSNTATTGSGIYVNSYFYMSKSAKVTSGIYLYTGNKIIINDDLDNSNAATITLEGAKRKNQVLDGSKVAANYSKITYSGSKYIIDNAGCLRLKNSVKIKYNMGINDDKASPGSFKLKNKTDGALTNSFTIISGYTDTVTDDANFTSNPLKDPATGYIDKIDVARSFYRWTYQKNGSAVTIDSSVNTYPDELADYVDSTNTIELTGSWMPASGDRIKEIWSSIVYDYDYYLNHSTFNVYTADQVTQIFSATEQNSLGSLGSSVPFTGKTIVFQEDINMGYLHTSKHNDNGTNTYISFEGHLDGNGKKLGAFIESNGTKVGLVGELAGGTIEGLTLQNRVVYNDGGTPLNVEISVGGIVGYITNDGGTIKNCTVDAAIGSNASMDCVGGIVGNIMATTNAFKVTITGCTKNGTVNGKQFVGGIVGSGSNGCTIKGNTMNAMVKHDGTSGNVGKIIGAGNLSSPNINTIGSSGSLGSHNSSVTENNTGY